MAKKQRTYDMEYKIQAVKLAKELGGAKAAADNIDYDILMGGMEMKGRSYPETPPHEYLPDIRAGLYLYSSTFFLLS